MIGAKQASSRRVTWKLTHRYRNDLDCWPDCVPPHQKWPIHKASRRDLRRTGLPISTGPKYPHPQFAQIPLAGGVISTLFNSIFLCRMSNCRVRSLRKAQVSLAVVPNVHLQWERSSRHPLAGLRSTLTSTGGGVPSGGLQPVWVWWACSTFSSEVSEPQRLLVPCAPVPIYITRLLDVAKYCFLQILRAVNLTEPAMARASLSPALLVVSLCLVALVADAAVCPLTGKMPMKAKTPFHPRCPAANDQSCCAECADIDTSLQALSTKISEVVAQLNPGLAPLIPADLSVRDSKHSILRRSIFTCCMRFLRACCPHFQMSKITALSDLASIVWP